jgi:DNA-binding CsgD family transcriptional regulator
VGLDAPLTHTKVFIFDRGGTTDFSERDRAVLEVLRPHLPRLYEAARARRRAREALALLEHTDSAVVVLDGRDGIEHATPQAQRLLSAYFDRRGAGLPEALAEWLPKQRRSDAPEPLRVSGDGGLLLVHLAEGSLLLEEQRTTPLLTEREREILDLVAEGKTNAEIAEAIWIAPGTVRKHLENIYEKLGVHSRTAAVAALNGET